MNIAEILKGKQERILKEHEDVLWVSTLLSFKGNQLSQKYPTEVEVNKNVSVDNLMSVKENVEALLDESVDIFYQYYDCLGGEDEMLIEKYVYNNFDFQEKTFVKLNENIEIPEFSITITSHRESYLEHDEDMDIDIPDLAWSSPVLSDILSSLGYNKPKSLDIKIEDDYIGRVIKEINTFNFDSYGIDFPIYIQIERDYSPRRNYIEFFVELLSDKDYMLWHSERVPDNIDFPLTAIVHDKDVFYRRTVKPHYRLYSTNGQDILGRFIYNNFIEHLGIFTKIDDFINHGDINLKVLINKQVDTDNLKIYSDYEGFRIFSENILVAAVDGLKEKHQSKVINKIKEFFRRNK